MGEREYHCIFCNFMGMGDGPSMRLAYEQSEPFIQLVHVCKNGCWTVYTRYPEGACWLMRGVSPPRHEEDERFGVPAAREAITKGFEHAKE